MNNDQPTMKPDTMAAPPHAGMVWIPAGQFEMGSDDHYPEERPKRAVAVGGFWIDATPVTNCQFRAFVEASGYITVSERPANPADYPGADPSMLVPASSVFTPTNGPVDLRHFLNWWRYIPGASWRHPLGPASDLTNLDDHPVVHVACEDVEAYARWAGLELPTEAEWEYACWAGPRLGQYVWGNELVPHGVHMANIWQGEFPCQNLAEDGWVRTSPVGTYPANRLGLFDMIGNVWEWTQDWWSEAPAAPTHSCCGPLANPRGGPRSASINPAEPNVPRKVLKGGSHLCAPSYCRRYRAPARHPQSIDTATSHIGFRCVLRPANTWSTQTPRDTPCQD